MANQSIGGTSPSQTGSNVYRTDLEELKNQLLDELKSLEQKVEEKQLRSVEVLGIFMAFLSFIAINVQIFSRVSSAWSAGLFILLFLCALAILIVLMDFFIKNDFNPRKKNLKTFFSDLFKDYRIILVLFFVAIGFCSVFLSRSFPLNQVQGTVEFDDILNKKIDSRIDQLIKVGTYTKTETDNNINLEAKIPLEQFKNCLNSSRWLNPACF